MESKSVSILISSEVMSAWDLICITGSTEYSILLVLSSDPLADKPSEMAREDPSRGNIYFLAFFQTCLIVNLQLFPGRTGMGGSLLISFPSRFQAPFPFLLRLLAFSFDFSSKPCYTVSHVCGVALWCPPGKTSCLLPVDLLSDLCTQKLANPDVDLCLFWAHDFFFLV